MTYTPDYTLPEELIQQLGQDGMDFIPELVRFLLNLAMKAERQNHIQANPYERSEYRKGQANGFKSKTVSTRLGQIELAIPQVRDSSFYPSALEKGLRSERALTIAIAEMYVQGVSTRKVTHILESLCGTEISSSMVSKASAELDKLLKEWREQAIGEVVYLYLDAHYEKVREGGQIRDMAVLTAMGVERSGKRRILGVSVSASEHEQHWRAFLTHLVQRGMKGVQLVISDDHAGLRVARRAVLGSVAWQRCQFHLQQNAQAYIPRKEMRTEVHEDIRNVFQAPNLEKAEQLLKECIEKYEKNAKQLAKWIEENLREGLTVMNYPQEHRKRLRTNNALERVNREIERRTRTVSIFPNDESCLRMVSAILMETDEEWQTGKVYLTIAETEKERAPKP
jgi:transposase-like protein